MIGGLASFAICNKTGRAFCLLVLGSENLDAKLVLLKDPHRRKKERYPNFIFITCFLTKIYIYPTLY